MASRGHAGLDATDTAAGIDPSARVPAQRVEGDGVIQML